MPIHQEISLVAAPERVYQLLTDTAEFASVTERPAEIEATEGGRFSIFGGHIQGLQIELVPGKRIVQSWRSAEWASGAHSLVRFTLIPEDNGTKLILDQDAYPEGPSPRYATWYEHLSTNWPVFYFEPIANHFAA